MATRTQVTKILSRKTESTRGRRMATAGNTPSYIVLKVCEIILCIKFEQEPKIIFK
jgi:hypothetical protein